MSIVNLIEEPGHIRTLAEWHHAEWSYLNPNGNVELRAEKMFAYLSDDIIPSTFIYKKNDELAGSAALVQHDMDTHKELSPWLASVYVKPEFRKHGIGSKLVLHVMRQAKSAGFSELFLFTDGQEDFYTKLGWSVYSGESYRGYSVTIMKAGLHG